MLYESSLNGTSVPICYIVQIHAAADIFVLSILIMIFFVFTMDCICFFLPFAFGDALGSVFRIFFFFLIMAFFSI